MTTTLENEWVLRRYGEFVVDIQIPLDGEELLLGRGRNRGIQYAVGVSRTHALLKRTEDGQWKIQDLGSTNGLFVNFIRIASHCFEHLKEFDIIGLGVACGRCEEHYSFMLCRKLDCPPCENELTHKPTRDCLEEVDKRGNYAVDLPRDGDFSVPTVPDKDSICESSSNNFNLTLPTAEEVKDKEIFILSYNMNHKRKRKYIVIIDDSDCSDIELVYVQPKRRKVHKRKHAGITASEKEQIYNKIEGKEIASHLSDERGLELTQAKVQNGGPIDTESKDDRNCYYSHTCDQEKHCSQYNIPQPPDAISKDCMANVGKVQSVLQNDHAIIPPEETNFGVIKDEQRDFAEYKKCAISYAEVQSSNSCLGDATLNATEENDVSDGCLNDDSQSVCYKMHIDDSFRFDETDSDIDETELRNRIVWPPKPDDSTRENTQLSQMFVNVDQESNSEAIEVSSGIYSHSDGEEKFPAEGSNNGLIDEFQTNDDTSFVNDAATNFSNYVDSSDSGIHEEQTESSYNTVLPMAESEMSPFSSTDERDFECKENSEERNCSLNAKSLTVDNEHHINSSELIEALARTTRKVSQEKEEPAKDVRCMPFSDGGTTMPVPKVFRQERLKRTSSVSDTNCKYNTVWSKSIFEIVKKLPDPNAYATDSQGRDRSAY